MKTTMTHWLACAASFVLIAPSLACDTKSTEIGATVGEETAGESEETVADSEETTDGDESTGGEETTGGETSDGEETSDSGATTGGGPAESCDPLGDPCPNTQGASQECEPTADGESWSCVPQFAGTSPTYGDECWPEDSPSVACTGETICLPADGLGVAGCDGGEGGGCCTQLCDLTLGEGNPCPDEGQFCRPFYGDEQPPAGYEHVGVCQLD